MSIGSGMSIAIVWGWSAMGHSVRSIRGRAGAYNRYAYRSAFHRALCLPTVRAGGPPRGQEDWGQGRL